MTGLTRWGGVALVAAAAGAGVLGLSHRRRVDLRGQVALVTGGSRGLGLLIARELARQGCRLAICGRDRDILDRAEKELSGVAADVLAVTCDVADPVAVEQFLAQVVDRYGRLDIVVNNAGVIQVGPLESTRVEAFRDAMDTMFWGPLHVSVGAVPVMRERGYGRIANIASIGGALPVPHMAPYACAKAAQIALSESSHAELAQHGITVTTVVPGLMRTGSHLHAYFSGRAGREFGWFSALAGLPPLSMDAERAARRIVDAIRRGAPELILTPMANVAVRVHALAPGLTARALVAVDRILPSAPEPEPRDAVEGTAARSQLHSPWLERLTTLNRRAAQRFGQVAGR